MATGAADDPAAQALTKRLSLALRAIRAAHPFFGALALFAHYRMDDRVGTAGTDGKTIWLAPSFAGPLSKNELEGLVVHELLHCALEHHGRRKSRAPRLWNIAADIVVNAMIRDAGRFDLPAGCIEDASLAHLSVEEIYERLLSRTPEELPDCVLLDLGNTPEDLASPGPQSLDSDEIHQHTTQQTAAYWRSARQQALVVARMHDPRYGGQAAGSQREFGQLESPSLSWRELLWQFVVRTPNDFVGFDRRFVWRKLYLDAMEGDHVELRVAIDTSGSVDEPQLTAFMSELMGIFGAYPHLSGQLYFADAALYGPYPLDHDALSLKPVGGGGTSFAPFFRRIDEEAAYPPPVCLYFTDGYGEFPQSEPDVPVLWVVARGGLDTGSFPFGTVARMADE